MTVRPIILLAAIVFGLAAFMDEAAAQYYPAAPNYPAPYSYPQGGYRGVPDQDGIMNLDPDEDDDEPMPPQRQPQAGRPGNDPYQQGAPYPYNPRDAGVQPYDPGMNRPVPQQGYIPNQNSSAVPGAPYGHYGDRTAPGNANVPADINPDLRPPAVIEANRPPANIAPRPPANIASLPPEEQPEEGEHELSGNLKRQMVDYPTKEPAGSIIIDTAHTYLYYVLGNGQAIRYGIGVGREGFTWSGTERITKMAEWPDWYPPAEMIERQPYLPRMMAGGLGSPLGARALYLGKTVYRIHGTNQPSTIGKTVSSGCIRLLNEDIEDLYNRVRLGTRVVVLAGNATGPSVAR